MIYSGIIASKPVIYPDGIPKDARPIMSGYAGRYGWVDSGGGNSVNLGYNGPYPQFGLDFGRADTAGTGNMSRVVVTQGDWAKEFAGGTLYVGVQYEIGSSYNAGPFLKASGFVARTLIGSGTENIIFSSIPFLPAGPSFTGITVMNGPIPAGDFTKMNISFGAPRGSESVLNCIRFGFAFIAATKAV